MLSQLVAAIRGLNEQPGFAALVEYLQQENSDFDTLAAEVSAAAAVDPEIARLELAATLRQMEMEKLTTEMNQLARSDMQLEEIRSRYQQLMARQQVLRQQAAAARGAP